MQRLCVLCYDFAEVSATYFGGLEMAHLIIGSKNNTRSSSQKIRRANDGPCSEGKNQRSHHRAPSKMTPTPSPLFQIFFHTGMTVMGRRVDRTHLRYKQSRRSKLTNFILLQTPSGITKQRKSKKTTSLKI